MNSRQHYFSLVSQFTLLAALLAPVTPTLTRAASPSPQSANSDLQSSADRGDAGAQYRLAKNLLSHNPTPAQVDSSLRQLRASAAQNNPDALFYLGYLYEHGQYVPKSYTLAVQNYQAAVQLHYALAENNLASLYQHGQGVPKSISKAIGLYHAAAQQGNPVAQINLASLYYTGEGVPRNDAEAIRWLHRAADSGFPEAQNNLAYFYYYGVGIQRDYTEAARLIRSAADTGLPGAELSLGYIYEQGKGVPLDYVSAYTWYSRAASAGNKDAVSRRAELAQIMTRRQLDAAILTANAYASHGALPSSARSAISPNSLTPFSLFPH